VVLRGVQGDAAVGERAARAGDIEALRKLAERLDSYLARVRPVFE